MSTGAKVNGVGIRLSSTPFQDTSCAPSQLERTRECDGMRELSPHRVELSPHLSTKELGVCIVTASNIIGPQLVGVPPSRMLHTGICLGAIVGEVLKTEVKFSVLFMWRPF